MLYISIFCIFLSIFLFTYNKNLLSPKKISGPIRLPTLYKNKLLDMDCSSDGTL